MNNIKNLNMKLSVNNNLHNLKNNIYKEKKLKNNKFLSNKKTTKITQLIIKLSDKIIYSNKTLFNLLNKNEYNLNIYKSEILKDLNKEYSQPKLNESKLIYRNEQQYIKLISPFNFKFNYNIIKITLFYY